MKASPEDCAEELEGIYLTSRVYRASVELREAPSPEVTGGEVSLLVKSVHEPSIDEVPLLNALLDSFDFAEIYEYERVAEVPEGDRTEHMVKFILDALSRNRGLIIVAPDLMSVSLAGRLPDEVAEELDSAGVADVSVTAENTLYLPLPDAVEDSPVEIVAKANSRSSYERVSWLMEEARRRGLNVRGPTFMPDNRSVMEYVTSTGSRGYAYRVPVTKLAAMLVAFDRCSEQGLVEEVRRAETSTHTVYALRVPEEYSRRLLGALSELQRRYSGAPLLRPSPKLQPLLERGLRESMAELMRRLGAF
ncbi:hypothetical protein ASAC_0624 [Acidilobus saccharovorans 345-15]|uniref:Uncharacterized protein n=1 Tax=Acidilobus saccharovorans (strain DSM 16705 / JCM 18335 / VKM B-2471 / 345-15) TaxID=666510 RepID=D9Q143_ACIS3|nr:hypothetical protein [Acidilobus saccharovorans]ADL19031.1 hypothetical protein ASAC_0624 [Acidilobus saccharovorans 345-15]